MAMAGDHQSIILYKYSANIVEILHKYRTNTIKILHKYFMNIFILIYINDDYSRPPSKYLAIPNKCTNISYKLYKYLAKNIQILDKYNYLINTLELQRSSQYHSNTIIYKIHGFSQWR